MEKYLGIDVSRLSLKMQHSIGHYFLRYIVLGGARNDRAVSIIAFSHTATFENELIVNVWFNLHSLRVPKLQMFIWVFHFHIWFVLMFKFFK